VGAATLNTLTCDGCGTSKSVRPAFVTVWNGTVFDLCPVCAAPLVILLDEFWLSAAQREQQS